LSEVVDRFLASPTDLAVCRLVPDGETWLPVKITLDFGHGGRWRCLCVITLLKASLLQLLSTRLAPRETLDMGLPNPTMAMRNAALLAGGIWSRGWLEVALRWSGVPLPVLTTVGLGGMASHRLGGGHGLRCVCREEVPSGAMVVSSAGPDKVYVDLNHENCSEVRLRWQYL
jgi:hypothetical protein